LIKPGVGKAVVDVDMGRDPERATVVTVMAKEDGMNRFNRIASKVEVLAGAIYTADGEAPEWVGSDFISKLDIGGTILKPLVGTYYGYKIWVLRGKVKIYKDQYGWVSAQWSANPVLRGREWVMESDLSFAPATNGSFANDKFDEFRKVVDISGEKDVALFGIHSRKLVVRPRDGEEAKEINEAIRVHLFDLKAAREFWKNVEKSRGAAKFDTRKEMQVYKREHDLNPGTKLELRTKQEMKERAKDKKALGVE
jgi:hypothetical protein